MLAKVLLQKLWQHKVDWYDFIPFNLETEWRNLKAEFMNLNSLRIGRHYFPKWLNLADVPYNKKHPILLSSKHRLTELLCKMEHGRLLHSGPQLLLSNLRKRFWILGGRNLIRKITH